MLILAGVAVSVLTEDGGLFGKTKNATDLYEQAANTEKKIMENLMNYIDLNIKHEEEEEEITEEEMTEEEALVFLEHFETNEYEGISSAYINTNNKKVGEGSLYLNNTSITNSTGNFKFESDFTIDFWLNLSSSNLSRDWAPILVVKNTNAMWIGLNYGKFVVRGYGVTSYIEVEPPTTDEWVHVAISRNNNILYLFYNGILQSQVENTTVFPTGTLYMGNDGGSWYTVNSYIDELRILNNSGEYTTNFTPTTNEYDKTNGIVYHFEPSTILSNNAVLSGETKKFGNYSKYFNNTSTGYASDVKYRFDKNFTIDFWAHLSSENITKAGGPILVVANTNAMWIGFYNYGKFVVRGYNVTNYIEAEPPTTGEWVHIAITRKNNMLYLFYNGVLQEKVENEIIFPEGNLYLGVDGRSNWIVDSYIDELRILNGHCKWTKNFDVPTREYVY